MGLFDSIRAVLGVRAEADATRGANPEALFGLSTAYVTMEAELEYAPAGEAALCFAAVDSTDFAAARDEVERILDVGEVETGTRATYREDTHGYHWVVLRDDDFEDLLTSVHFTADTLVEQGFGSRLLAAVFAFVRGGRHVYWIYSFRRGSFYPFVPTGGRERDTAAEFKLGSVLEDELDVEDDRTYWYPLWPEDDGHPWE